jgi:hypothetical protein
MDIICNEYNQDQSMKTLSSYIYWDLKHSKLEDLLSTNIDFNQDLIPLTLRAYNDFKSVSPEELLLVISNLQKTFAIPKTVFSNELVYLAFQNVLQDESIENWKFNNFNFVILKLSYYRWELYDEDAPSVSAIGSISDGGMGSIDNTTRIALGLNSAYHKQGIGTALMQKYINDLIPKQNGFEAKGYMEGSRKIVQKLGFTYSQEHNTFIYKK